MRKVIRLEAINKKFTGFALKDVNIEVSNGEYYVLLGRSGSGKSLILEIIAGLQKPSSGKVIINGRDITSLPIHKRRIGFVFQNQSLFPHMTVRENIKFALNSKERILQQSNIDNLSDFLNILHLMERFPLSLSLGESHRVALVRTLVTNPSCLLLDEPLSSLDAQSKYEIRSLLRKINQGIVYFGESNKNKPMTVIHVTHDYEEALALSTRISVIEEGLITQEGKPQEVFRHPKSSFIAKFIGIKNFYRGHISKSDDSDICKFEVINEDENYLYFSVPKPEIFTQEEYSLTIRSEDVILSLDKIESSVRNIFHGVITDIENAVNGVEITVDIGGLDISSLITYGSFKKMNLQLKQTVYAGFKASAVRFA
ncbi:MAG TPA: ABC transporter [Lentisphaeria bacterium]|nr:ABC transporter [Lentisphaeria bacterium]